MRHRFAAIVAGTALAAAALVAAPAVTSADAPAVASNSGAAQRGARCVIAGLGTLRQLGLLQAAARQQVDYSDFADAEEGPIFADLPDGSFLPLGEVIRLHRSNPDLFAWCR